MVSWFLHVKRIRSLGIKYQAGHRTGWHPGNGFCRLGFIETAVNSVYVRHSLWAYFISVYNIASDHKHLGFLLSGNGTLQSHIEYMKAKDWKRKNIMRKLKFEMDRTTLETIYLSLIRSILEYADIVWDNYSMHEKKD